MNQGTDTSEADVPSVGVFIESAGPITDAKALAVYIYSNLAGWAPVKTNACCPVGALFKCECAFAAKPCECTVASKLDGLAREFLGPAAVNTLIWIGAASGERG